MKRRIQSWMAGMAVALMAAGPVLAEEYWDINGDNAGATDNADGTAAGNWLGAPNWSSSSSGGSTHAWPGGAQYVYFSAGNNATGTYDVSVGADVQVNNLHVQEGNVTLKGAGTLKYMGAANSYWSPGGKALNISCPVELGPGQSLGFFTSIGGTSWVSGVVSGTNGIRTAGGTHIFSALNTFTGPVILEAGSPVGTLSINTIRNMYPGSGDRAPYYSSLGAPDAANAAIIISGAASILKYTGTGDNTDRPFVVTSGNDSPYYGPTLEQAGAGPLVYNGNFTPNPGKSILLYLGGSPAFPGIATAEFHGNISNPTNNNSKAVAVYKTGTGVWILSGTNTYKGNTTIADGVLRLASANALPADSPVYWWYGGVLELGVGDFTRSVGTNVTEVNFNNGSAGFSAYGANRIVNLYNDGRQVGWLWAGASLVFGSVTANAQVEFKNAIDLGSSSTRTIRVDDNPNTNTDVAVLSGTLSGSYSTLAKTGAGTLMLSASNTYANTTISAGMLVAAHACALGTGTPTVNSNAAFAVAAAVTYTKAVTFNAGAILAGQGTFSTNNWTTPAGLVLKPGLPAGAPTGTLTVDVGGPGKTLTLGTNNTLQCVIQPDGTCGKLYVNGVLDISAPTARIVVSGTAPVDTVVLAEGSEGLMGTFAEANVDLTGMSKPGCRIRCTATQVVLRPPSSGSVIIVL